MSTTPLLDDATGVKLPAGTPVRFFSAYGPCIPAEVVKANRTTHTLKSFGKIANNLIHTVPCPSCRDHENSQYKDGFLD